MSQFLIHESNLERLEKKITTIKNKCIKNNIAFSYSIVGEKYLDTEREDGTKYTAKYFEVEVEGSMKHDGWRFAAVLEHTDAGNIVRSMDTELQIPERFRTCGPTCEHCNRIRSRKDTYVVYNEESGEFKQVGKQCLQEYTNGLDAEEVARYISMFDEMIKGESYAGSSYKSYLEVAEVVRYAVECVKHFGYEKSCEVNPKTTRVRVIDYMRVDRHQYSGRTYEALRDEMDEVGFDANSEYAVKTSEAALEWIRNNSDNNDYIHNLKVATAGDYAEWRDLGLLVSLPVAYNRTTEKAAEQKKVDDAKAAARAIELTSEYVGDVKSKLTVKTDNFNCVTTFYNQFGTTFLYKWSDENNNVFIWYASNPVNDEDLVIEVTGTVKDHSEFNGVKQTVMTRCKVVKTEKKEEHPEGTFNLDEIMYPWEEVQA